MRKGIIFSIDAMLALTIVILLFAAFTALQTAEDEGNEAQMLLYTKAADNAGIAYYTGQSAIDAPSTAANHENCKEIFEYDTSTDDIGVKVKKCERLQ